MIQADRNTERMGRNHLMNRPKKHDTIEGITEYELENGLRVLLLPDPSKATITLNIVYLVGSMHEGYGETGSAHLLEHLVYKGTPTFPNVPEALNRHGASWNGTTWVDRTHYFETLPASEENLDFVLHLEADRMVNSFIRAEDLASEMTVVRNEFEMGENSPVNILSQRMLAAAYLFHGYGHATIGARSDIEGMPIERLQAFYRHYYQPDNAVVVLAGRFDPDDALERIVRYFGAIPKPERRLVPPYTVEPPQDGERVVTLRRVGEVGAAGVLYHVPAAAHPDAAALHVLTEVLGAVPGGRLHKALIETHKAVHVQAFHFLLRDPGVVEFLAEVRREGSLEEVRDELLEITQRVGVDGVSEAEIDRARRAILKRFHLAEADSERLAVELTEWIAMGEWRLFFLFQERLSQVGKEAVERVAREYLQPVNATIGIFEPTSAPARVTIPPVEHLSAEVARFSAHARREFEVEAFDPTPANLEARTKRLTLESGMRLALLPKKTRRGQVVARFQFYLGDTERLLEGNRSVNALVAALLERGTKKRSRQEIKDRLDHLDAELVISGALNVTSVTITTLRDSLPEVLRLLAEILQEPAFLPQEFEQLKSQRLADLEEKRHDPSVLASRELQRHLFPYPHIRFLPTLPHAMKEIASVSIEEVRAFHEAYYGATCAFGSVVGDCEPDQIVEICETAFGGWRSAQPAERISPMYPGIVEPVRTRILTPDKANARIVLGETFPIFETDPDYPALVLASYLFGESQLDSRLSRRLRQKEGFSYGAYAVIRTDVLGNCGTFTASAIFAPENIDRVEEALFEEISSLCTTGFSAEEIEKGKAGYLSEEAMRLSNDFSLSSRMTTDLLCGRDFSEITEWNEKIGTLTADRVNEAVSRHLDPERISLFAAGEFPKA
ncbi:MAG: insulinase family protein [Deltaproteobacteria bacterium]|nr:MAG: insulinase family protein [Deltaproteobacteria bacterium]